MKQILILSIGMLTIIACQPQTTEIKNIPSPIIGTWQLVYGEVKQDDSVTVNDLSKTEFIKIINETHFAFLNQNKADNEGFYAGAGTYTLTGNDYVEKLDYIRTAEYRGHTFPFTVEFKGDSLIQYGLEEIKEDNIKRYIIEKYIRVK
jgi:hypothetical protein